MSEPDQHISDAARLVPTCPPGRGTRKARAFSEEIARLHALDYTLDAIRVALASVGVHVSRSTVYREVARGGQKRLPAAIELGSQGASAHRSTSLTSAIAKPAEEQVPAALSDDRRGTSSDAPSGKDHAEAFFNAHPSNPLFPTKGAS